MSSNFAKKQIVFFEEPVRMPSLKSRRADVVRKVLELAQAAKEQAVSRPASVPLPGNERIDFGSYRPSSVHFTIRPTPKHIVAAAAPADVGPPPNEPLPAADEPLPAANPSRKMVSRNVTLRRALQMHINRRKREKWDVQFPKRVVPTSNGGHLILSNHPKREDEKLFNAINREHRPRKKPSWLKPSTN